MILYWVIAARDGKVIRVKREGSVEANETARELRERGWTVRFRAIGRVYG